MKKELFELTSKITEEMLKEFKINSISRISESCFAPKFIITYTDKGEESFNEDEYEKLVKKILNTKNRNREKKLNRIFKNG